MYRKDRLTTGLRQRKYRKYRKIRNQRILAGFLAIIMVLGTVNMLIVPALTKEKKAYCGQEESKEHTHTLQCFSDPEADAETQDQWESTVPDIQGEGYAEKLISTAESQLSYAESSRNYLVRSDGKTPHGWTRYGAWAYDPYMDWSAAFAGFVIHYAGLDGVMAYDTGSVSGWMALAGQLGTYRDTSYEPKAGDIVFLNTDEDSDAPEEHMGIITGVSDEKISVIEGNREGAVKSTSYARGSYEILGFQERPLDEAEEAELQEQMAEEEARLQEEMAEEEEQAEAAEEEEQAEEEEPVTEEEEQAEAAEDEQAEAAEEEEQTEAAEEEEQAEESVAADDPEEESLPQEETAPEENPEETEVSDPEEKDAAEEDEYDSLTYEGEDYKVTVKFGEEAKIPEGTRLVVKEIDPESDEYLQYLGQLWTEVNKKYFEVEEMREHYDESMGDLPDERFININMARFFDISLIKNIFEIEPEAPVSVEINYTRGLYSSEEMNPGVVHFISNNEIDVIDEVETDISDNEVKDFRYEQDSFSVVGTYVGQEVDDVITKPNLAAAPDPDGEATCADAGLTDEIVDGIIRASGNKKGLLRAKSGERPYTEDDTELEKPVGNKTLVPNTDGLDGTGTKDGTYTLTLSVKGHSNQSSETNVKKSNVLVVMDRSSSMIKKTVSDETTRWYYGTKNTSSFRPDIDESNGYHFYGIVNGKEVSLNVSADWNGNVTITYQSGYSWGRPQYSPYPDDAPIYVVSKKTRMTAEQEALSGLFNQLMDQNNARGEENDDIVEVSVISFGDERFDEKSWSSETEVGWTKGRETSPLTAVTSSNRFTSGTNWEEALQYAYDIISAKKEEETAAGKNEDYYVIFLTDGEPTAVEGESGSAYHTTDPATGKITKGKGNIYAYGEAKDEAAKLAEISSFYNIFTYRNGEDEKYSVYLTNYAYGNGDKNGDKTTEAVQKYYTDAQTIDSLKDAFNNIFFTVENAIGHANVSITDTLTTDAMTTTIVQGKTNGYVYTVTKPNPNDPDHPTELYTVTAAGDIANPTVEFSVPGSAQQKYHASASEVGGKTVYSVTTAEGKVYKMALADVNDTTGELVWDLSPVGMLLNDCTYSVSFIVWPDQDAYDYVAALNNGLKSITNSKGETVKVEWDEDAAEDTGRGYATGGVETYPSIVKYPNGTFAVLTNTDQKLHYSVVETTSDGTNAETTVTGPFYQELPLPEPMPLTATASQVLKEWKIDRDPEVMAQLLYNPDGTSKEYSIGFEILQGAEEKHYTDVTLGWDEKNGQYVWEDEGRQTVPYNGHDCEVGTKWASDFSIATGLMLSTDRMDALGLDKSAYPSAAYGSPAETYYILEEGHDYTIKEPGISYEFDFSAPVYHPMLVDGVLTNVNLTKDGDNITIDKMSAISVETEGEKEGVSSLVITNTLRGYIHLNKIVVDKDGQQLPNDETKFEYTITLNNAYPVFEGDSIPWYGINGLFYHDADFNYYQATVGAQAGHLTLKDEKGDVYEARCEGRFDPDIIGPTSVTYTDKSGTEKTISLYGNRMNTADGNDTDGYKEASATLKINQSETLNIANVPVNTTYTITESDANGYELAGVTRKVGDGEEESIGDETVEGTIVANTDNNITYKNRCEIIDITIQKLDSSGHGLEGAVFQLLSVDGSKETPAAGIGGIGTVTKTVNGETKNFESAFETTGEEQTLSRLPDGIYKLKEVYIPEGYISTYGYIQFTIEDHVMKDVTTDTGETGKLDFTAASGSGAGAKLALLKITNEPGVALPNTGGPGTRLFTIFGMILVFGAGLLLMRRRKTDK